MTKANENETQETKLKTYESPIYRSHQIGNSIRFVNGTYTAKSKGEEKTIESDPLFGFKIFLIK